MRQNSTRFLIWWRKNVASEKSWSKRLSTRLRPMLGNATYMGKSTVDQSISTRSIARCRIKRNALMKFTTWLPFAVSWILQAMSMPCWDTSMSSGSQCRGVLRTILPTGRPMATSPSIRLYMALKDRLNSRSEPRRCTRLPNTGLRLTGLTKKASKVKSTVRNLLLGWTGSRRWWNSKTSQAMPRNSWKM